MKRQAFFADLTHTAQGISAATFPLGISFIVSYAAKELGSDFDFRLFKFPEALEAALREDIPNIICFSNYSWNLRLAYKFAALAKARKPEVIVIFGGPNFPVDPTEKQQFLSRYSDVDFYVELEGELGFVDLLRKLGAYGLDSRALRAGGDQITNCSYLNQELLVTGPISRIADVNIVPSPYLNGLLDEFFDLPLVPMLETTRGCPFSCTFCSDGLLIKSKVHRYDPERTNEELAYIAKRVTKSEEIIITDLNFGMYQEDLSTARVIAEMQQRYHWPVLVRASAGKNKTERVIETASLLNGSWMIGAAIQSYDADVLRAIKRSNISTEAFKEFIDYSNKLSEDALTYTEIILGLPGDTKEKHLTSLRFGVDNDVNSLRMYQAMVLAGTEMGTQTCRSEFGLKTRFRTIPGCVGMYLMFGEQHPVAETEEIIVGSKSMTFEEYVDCRVMDLIVETFYNNALFEEIFGLVRALGGDVFECLLYVKDHPELYSERMQEIISEFVVQTGQDLYVSQEEADRVVLTPEVIERYVGGELGINELLVSRASLFMELPSIGGVLAASVKRSLAERGLLDEAVEGYLDQVVRFVIYSKGDVSNTNEVMSDIFDYDFRAVAERRFRVDPHELEAAGPLRYTFYHDAEQRRHIDNLMGLYAATPIGLGRFIQRSNLKRMYRRYRVEPVGELTAVS